MTDIGDRVRLTIDVSDDPHLADYDGAAGTIKDQAGPRSYEVQVDDGPTVLAAEHEFRGIDDG